MYSDIGKKIKFFRVREGLSQLDLELAIHAAQGSISRIESGRVNPTKETIWSIATHMGLGREDTASLFGLDMPFPKKEDVSKARGELKEYFEKSSTVALLLDPHWNVVYASKGFLKIAGIPRSLAEVGYGTNLLVAIFKPPFSFWKKLDNGKDFLPYELWWFKKMMGDRLEEEWAVQLVSDLKKEKIFREYWDEAQSLDLNSFPVVARKVVFKIGKKYYTFVTNFTQLNSDPRFEVLDYLVISN